MTAGEAITRGWVTFHDEGTTPSGKTRIWRVSGSGGVHDTIGRVKWSGAWRKYVLVTVQGGAMFAPSCLTDIATFCEEQTRARA